MKNWLSIAFLGLIVGYLAIVNYIPGTWLTGWDNLHPEFDFWLNIKRSLFAVWQEYQGLGLLGGMGHATDLLHQVFLWLLSFIVPLNTLRYFYHFLMLFIGAAGAYFLIRSVILVTQSEAWRHPGSDEDSDLARMTPFFGALFYILNLGTIQTFYAPFESFIAHFASLPWLLLATILFFRNQTKTNTVLLFITLFLATPQAYIPTLFVVFLIATAILLTPLIISHLHNHTESSSVLFTGAKFYMLVFFANAFWLLPFLYFTVTNAHVNVEAKINQMATDTIFLQNKEFGNIQDVMLLKGFWFNNVDPNRDGNFTFMMQPWRAHLEDPFITAIGYLFFAIIVIGIIQALKTRKPVLLGFSALFLFSFTMLATNTPPFSWIDMVFRKIPLFDQAFRFPFTKFSILASLTYSIFFAIGIQKITSLLKGKLLLISYLLSLISLIVFTLPAFQGHLFYEKERLTIPKEYFDLFDFFRKQDPNTRIANFPQHEFWGWNFYRWGYGGSGFLWYGIKQPILDRAFDVWSKTDENYYFEISHALYSKNAKDFLSVLNKYNINWILIDKNIINPSSPKALFSRELKELIKQISDIKPEITFGNIEVYKVTLKDNPKNFIYLVNNPLTANPYTWGESDQAYKDYGNYISENNEQVNAVYPFRTLFSNKTQQDIEFVVHEGYDDLTFIANLPKRNAKSFLTIPSFLQQEDSVPVDIVVKKNKDNTLELTIKIYTPEVTIDNQNVYGGVVEKPLVTILRLAQYPLHLDINGIASYDLKNQDAYIQRTFLSTKTDNVFVLKDNTGTAIQTQIIERSVLKTPIVDNKTAIEIGPSDKAQKIAIKIPKISDDFIGKAISPHTLDVVKNCDNFRKGDFSSIIGAETVELRAKNASACTSVYVPTLFHRPGYFISVANENKAGRPPHIWIFNDGIGKAIIDTYLAKDKTVNNFILSPQDPFGKGYSLHIDNISIGSDETINNLSFMYVYPIPYNFLTAIAITNTQEMSNTAKSQSTFSVSHPNESIYIVEIKPAELKTTLMLSQSFNSGWKAYQVQSSKFKVQSWIYTTFPFIFGKELKEHVLVNNWANGWILNNSQLSTLNSQLVIIFLPQYLEYLGFVLLIGTFGWFFVSWLKNLYRSTS